MVAEVHHQPLKGILDRDLAIAEARDMIAKWSPYLEDIVNYATNAFVRCEESMQRVDGTPSSLIYLYYPVIQIADGIQTLCASACFDASIPLLRSLWEGTISIEYMLEEDFENRSSAWLACCYAKNIGMYESLDPTTQRGKEMQAIRKKDKLHGNLAFLSKTPEWIGDQMDQTNKKLSRVELKEALEQMKADPRKPRKWYSINGGPMDLERLAERLGRPLEYQYLYRYFSEMSHATDVGRAIMADKGRLCLAPLRNSSNAGMIYSLTITYLIQATQSVVSKLRPEEEEHVRKQLADIMKRHRPEAFSR
jgi:hypothetical protein